jgi:transcriptional regulator with XRE-family HTH domain
MTLSPGRRKRTDSRYAPQAAELAARIRALRVRAELTQEQLALRAGVAVSTLRKIETGKITEPGYFTILAILHVLQIGKPITGRAEVDSSSPAI